MAESIALEQQAPQHIRARRSYRAHAAAAIRQLDERSAPNVSWEDLAQLPHWCLIDSDDLLQLQRIAGLIFLSPTLRSTIDGRQLSQVRAEVGDAVFADVMELELPTMPVESVNSKLSIGKQLRGCGAAVLLATLPHASLAPLFQARVGRPVAPVNPAVAEKIYLLASEVQEKVRTR